MLGLNATRHIQNKCHAIIFSSDTQFTSRIYQGSSYAQAGGNKFEIQLKYAYHLSPICLGMWFIPDSGSLSGLFNAVTLRHLQIF